MQKNKPTKKSLNFAREASFAIPSLSIRCGARDSPLSRAQVREVEEALLAHSVRLDPLWIKTTGDLDRTVSLRTLGKSDFFTRELDQLLLSGQIRLAVHSAKDLPEPLPKGLAVAALTKGQDPRDSLVFSRPLSDTPRIATSSARREQNVRLLYPRATFLDLRGTIHERLQVLETSQTDGVVVAEAALIRLGLTHVSRVFLPGDVAEGQGRLAIVVREEDQELRTVFRAIHDDSLPWP